MVYYRRNSHGLPIDWIKYHQHHWEVYPILGVVGCAILGYAFISLYMLTSRPDVQWYRGQKTDHYAEALEHPYVSKLIKINEQYPPNLDLASTYREMEKKEKELNLNLKY